MTSKSFPHYAGRFLLGNFPEMQKDLIDVLAKAKQDCGDYARVQVVGPFHIYSITDPKAIKYVLVNNSHNYNKGSLYWLFRRWVGNGLFTSDGGNHLHQRKLIQPAFHKNAINSYFTIMHEFIEQAINDWQHRLNEPIDIASEMRHITLQIASKCIFDIDLNNNDTVELRNTLTRGNQALLSFLDSASGFLPAFIPTRINRELRSCKRQMDMVIRELINKRRLNLSDDTDLLSMLIRSQETDKDFVSDELIKDEVLTFFFTGHESTANTLSFTWYLLSRNPNVEKKLHDELEEILAGRIPDIEDLERLKYTQMVIKETLRLFPVEWLWIRQAVKDDVINDQFLPAKSHIFISPSIVHTDPRWHENPFLFNPERFLPDSIAARPSFTYFPFGAGPRQCIGKPFFEMEATLLFAAMAQYFKPRIIEPYELELETLLFLSPKGGMPMLLVPR